MILTEAECAGLGCAGAKTAPQALSGARRRPNLGILMRLLIGAGAPREAAAGALAYLLFVYTEEDATLILVIASAAVMVCHR
jgi:hypothetical protein